MATTRKSTAKKTPPKKITRARKPAPKKTVRRVTPARTTKERSPAKPKPRAVSIVTQREKLMQEREEASVELERLRAELQEAPESTGDEVDLGVYDREKTLGLIATYERRLEEIDYALRATQKGTYGICERCGKPIDPARLKIYPEATLCVKCKNEIEQRAKRGLK